MASLGELAREYSSLGRREVDHLQRLVRSWGLLADLSMSDLLLRIPTVTRADYFITVGHIRPVTGTSVVPGDPMGEVVALENNHLLHRAWIEQAAVEGIDDIRSDLRPHMGSDETVEENVSLPIVGQRVIVQHLPVRLDGQLIAIMTRAAEPALIRHPNALEATYRALFDRFALMIEAGEFPFDDDEEPPTDFREPRVGDGLLVFDRNARVEYASPNALSALHRLGVEAPVVGSELDDQAIDTSSAKRALARRSPSILSLERSPDLVVAGRCLPLIGDGEVTGAVVLLRDISELRRRDRLLVSKDTTIREIHHRVKNNLQTISSLLRLQSRRSASPDAREAIDQSVRRIASIAVVHDALSLGVDDEVDFDDVVQPVVRMVEEGFAAPEARHRVEVTGSLGRLPGQMAMPLAVVLNELVQNAFQHGESTGTDDVQIISVTLDVADDELLLSVSDRGPGVRDGFSFETDAGLGLTIVRTFIVNDLRGDVRLGSRPDQVRGTAVHVRVPNLSESLPIG